MSIDRLQPLPLADVEIADAFLAPRMRTNRQVTLDTEYEQCRKTGRLDAYQWEYDPKAPPKPWMIWVGDVAKWIEAVAYSLAAKPDDRLAALGRDAIARMLKGQKPDGYLYCNPMAPEKRWAELRNKHEMYEMGHAIEAAVAWHQATGDRRMLDALCKTADLLDATFGSEEGKKRGYDGHEEIELALVKLYRATGNRRYLNLAKFFVEERGRQPHYFDLESAARGEKPMKDYAYLQAHVPVRQQKDLEGHAVRAMYLCCAVADVAAETDDAELLGVARRLWASATQRRMYVTGGIGSSRHGERFTFDYDLPNETAYAESCAAIGLVFFSHRMLQIDRDGRYADVIEQALYNNVPAGISLDGTRFFYGNPLTMFPKALGASDETIAYQRLEWFGCACCPPNIARMIASLGQYAYSQDADPKRPALYVHLYAKGFARFQVGQREVCLEVATDYPWDGKVALTVRMDARKQRGAGLPTRPQRRVGDSPPDGESAFALGLRIPGWCRGAKMRLNGKPVRIFGVIKKGYAILNRTWRDGDVIEIALPMPAERVYAHPRVRADAGKAALRRGPIVYCLEEVDNAQGLWQIALPRRAPLRARWDKRLFGGCMVIEGKAIRFGQADKDAALYRTAPPKGKPVVIRAVPYCFWCNRKPGEMTVFIRETP